MRSGPAAGQTVEKVADFSAGELSVSVVRNGKPSDAVIPAQIEPGKYRNCVKE